MFAVSMLPSLSSKQLASSSAANQRKLSADLNLVHIWKETFAHTTIPWTIGGCIIVLPRVCGYVGNGHDVIAIANVRCQ